MRIILLSLITIGLAFAEDIRLPDQARYRTVKDFGAIGDGVHDDTEALRRAIQGTGLLYIPNGTYLISEPLRVPERKGSAPARRILQGQSRAGTIIKLKDGSSAFADPKNPKPVFQISWGIAQAFRNGMRNLTIDVGADNPGAIGCAFMASNQGGMHHVTLTAGAGSGLRGLDLAVGDNGPLLINDLAVSGFKTGIYAKYGQSMTFEHITIKQAEVGIYNQHSLIFARDVTIDASYVGINGSSSSTLALIDARISNAQVAVSPQGGVFIRNLDATSCTAAIAESPEGPIIIEWANQRRHLFEPTLEHSLRLPIVDTPDVPWGDPQAWQAPLALQAKDDLRPDNWLKAYQNIVDSGAHTIYLPMGELRLEGELRVPASLRRIIGLEHDLAKDCKLSIRIIEPSEQPFIIERMDTIYAPPIVSIEAKRPVVISSMALHSITVAPGCGPLFVEDCVWRRLDIGRGAKAWLRQANLEYAKEFREHIRNAGDIWLLGFKNEGDATMVHTLPTGRSEIYAYVLANKATPSDEKPPMFIVDQGQMSLTLGESVLREQPYGTVVRETRNGETRNLRNADTPHRSNNGTSLGLYLSGQ